MAERRVKADPSAPRKRALVSCDRCKLRRARCIRNGPDEPCTDCKLSGVQCESKLPRKQRVYGSVETLSLRYRALEALVKGLFPHVNMQNLNVIFQLAAERNIPMPASDDYTPADIFNELARSRQHQDSPASSMRTHQPPCPPPLTAYHPSPSTRTPSSVSTASQPQRNPFSELREPRKQSKELVATRHGTSHYFGPSSSFRLAITVRAFVARCKAAGAVECQAAPGSISPSSESGVSLRPRSTNASDEEYLIPDPHRPPPKSRARKKRSGSHVEGTKGTDDQWETEKGRFHTIADLLPPRPLTDALVSAYFDHIHIHLPLFHRSMFQLKLEAMYSRQSEMLKDAADVGWLICVAMVFYFGCQQLHEHDPEQAQLLQLKFLSFVKTYFRKLILTTSLANVQALVLMNAYHHVIGQKSTSWLLIGLGARMAITMGMHRDDTNMQFDPIERNTRRQVWYSIYTFERVMCSILGRPSIIDDSEILMRIPDANMLEQMSPSAEYMNYASQLIRLGYTIRQRAYFDPRTAEERSPTHIVASTLLRECDEFYSTIPRHLSADHLPAAHDQKARILLMHIYYFYTRCVVTRDFLMSKVERNICYLEKRPPPPSDDWHTTMILAEDCVQSAHRSIQYMMDVSGLNVIGSALDLFFIFHSVLIVCADFLARPKQQQESPKDMDRKATVQSIMNHIRGIKELAPTYSILSRIAMQFASMTGVCDKPLVPGQPVDPALEPQSAVNEDNIRITDIQDDWFASAATNLGMDFYDLNQAVGGLPTPGPASDPVYSGYFNPMGNEVDDWTAGTLRGMHDIPL